MKPAVPITIAVALLAALYLSTDDSVGAGQGEDAKAEALAMPEGNATLSVQVVEQGGSQPVAQVEVFLERDDVEGRQVCATGEDGRATFENLEESIYRVGIVSESLPEGLMLPRDQILARRWRQPEGREVRVEGSTEAPIELERGARVRGTIFTPWGQPAHATRVSFGSLDGPDRWVESSYFDAPDGHFEAVLHPGRWFVTAGRMHWSPYSSGPRTGPPRSTHPLEGETGPLPVVQVYGPGGDHRLELSFGGGTGSLAGRVLDLDDRPVAGLQVLLHLRLLPLGDGQEPLRLGMAGHGRYGTTDEEGRFRFTKLHPGEYTLVFHPEAWSPWGDCLLAGVMPTVPITIGDDEIVRDFHVERASIVTVRGRIVPADGRTVRRDGSSTRFSAAAVLVPPGPRSERSPIGLSVEPDGTFEFRVEARMGTVRIEVWGAEPVTLELPEPGFDEAELEVTIPWPED